MPSTIPKCSPMTRSMVNGHIQRRDHSTDYSIGRTSPRQIPIVTCFLPNQSDGTAFKVSIHSWIAPNLSEELKYMAHQGKHPSYQARVFIDGDFVA